MASGDATPAEADYAARYLAHRLTLANPSVRIYQAADTAMAREASISVSSSLGASSAPPPRTDLILGTVVSRNTDAAGTNLAIEVFLVDANTGSECSRWQLAPEDEGPQICSETYSHPGDIAIAISGRKVGDSLRVGFEPVTRGGTVVETCGEESTRFRADLAAAILAPWGRRPAVLTPKPGEFFQYRTDNAATRAILKIDDAPAPETP